MNPQRSFCALAAVLALAGTLAAQPQTSPPPASPTSTAPTSTAPDPAASTTSSTIRPASAGRVVRLFDFEERADTTRPDFNPEPVPRQWFRAQSDPPERERLGFPQHNRAAYDLTQAHSGRVSIRLPSRGGSTALRLGTRVLPIFREPDYAVSAWIRTSKLEHAGAFLWAQLIDGQGQPIPGSVARTGPVRSPDEWTLAQLQIPGGFPDAAFIQIELQLLQPEQDNHRRRPHEVTPQDLEADAWFDDIRIVQLPRIEFATPSPTGIITGPLDPARPLLTGLVSDLTGESMTAQLTLTDLDNRPVASESRNLPPGGGTVNWSPTPPRFGWYRAALTLNTDAGTIASATADLLWLPPSSDSTTASPATTRPASARSLGVLSNNLLAWELPLLLSAIRETDLSAVTIPLPPIGAPTATAAPGTPSLADFRRVLDTLLIERREVTLALASIAPDLAEAQGITPQDVATLLARPEAIWLPSLRNVLDQYGQRVQRWQIELPIQPGELPPADLAPALNNFHQTLARFVPGPLVGLSWRADWSPPRELGALSGTLAMDLCVPTSFPPPALAAIVRDWTPAPPGTNPPATGLLAMPVRALTLRLQPPDAAYGPRAAVNDTFQRALEAWTAAGTDRPIPRLLLPDPWRTVGNINRGRLEPDARLGLWRTLQRHLAGRRVVGSLPSPPGVFARVLADDRSPGERTGALVAWSTSAEPGRSRLSAYLGAGPITLVDAFGNRSPLTPADATGLYHIETTATPVFVEGIDPELVLFLPGLRVDPEFIPAVAAEHRRELIITNPWATRLTGEIQFVQAPGRSSRQAWRFSPVTPLSFSLAPGQTQKVPFTFSFSAGQESGPGAIHAIVRLNTDRSYGPLRAALPIVIGLPDLELTPSVVPSPGPDGPDLTILATVANTGEQPRTLQISVQAAGRPVLQQPISNLGPKESAVRRFVLPGAAAALSGQNIRVTLLDIDGTERLNKVIPAP